MNLLVHLNAMPDRFKVEMDDLTLSKWKLQDAWCWYEIHFKNGTINQGVHGAQFCMQALTDKAHMSC